VIAEGLSKGRNAVAIWQDLVDRHGFRSSYASVRRYVVKLRGSTPVEARVVITTAPGEEARSTTARDPWSATARAGSTGARGCSC